MKYYPKETETIFDFRNIPLQLHQDFYNCLMNFVLKDDPSLKLDAIGDEHRDLVVWAITKNAWLRRGLAVRRHAGLRKSYLARLA